MLAGLSTTTANVAYYTLTPKILIPGLLRTVASWAPARTGNPELHHAAVHYREYVPISGPD